MTRWMALFLCGLFLCDLFYLDQYDFTLYYEWQLKQWTIFLFAISHHQHSWSCALICLALMFDLSHILDRIRFTRYSAQLLKNVNADICHMWSWNERFIMVTTVKNWVTGSSLQLDSYAAFRVHLMITKDRTIIGNLGTVMIKNSHRATKDTKWAS